jgi:hypothetical protein
MGWGKLRIRLALLGLTLAFASMASGQQPAVDLEGRAVDPFSSSDKIVVLVFVRRDCPISGRYAPSVQAISERYADRANFWLVYPDRSETPTAIRKSVSEYGYRLPALQDPDRQLVRRAQVQITPEVAVFGRNRRLVYDGRIDDWYIDPIRARHAPTTHELEDAIRAAVDGRSVAKNEVRGVGCYIADLP